MIGEPCATRDAKRTLTHAMLDPAPTRPLQVDPS